jgi:hypothetical protein
LAEPVKNIPMCVSAWVDAVARAEKIAVQACSPLGQLGAATLLDVGCRSDSEATEWILILWLDLVCFFDGCKGGGWSEFELPDFDSVE